MSYTALRDTLRIRLPGAVDGLINLELFNLLDEFCRTTNAYREVLSTQLEEGVQNYEITPEGKEILLVYQTAHYSLSVGGALFDDGVLKLPNPPTPEDLAYPLYTEVSLVPTDSQADPESWLPAPLYQRFHQALLDGTLSRMMSQVAKPYSSERMALFHGRRFRNHMALARARVVGDSEPGAGGNWRFPRHTR
jgi:hypothetical protein